MDVSVIIVNYNTAVITKDTIVSLFKQTVGVEIEVIIVDNASTDHSRQLLTENFQDKIEYIQLDENIGFGRANNVGLAAARGRNVFFLNPDVILLNNAVKILCDFIDSTLDCGVCGGNLYDENLKPSYSIGRMYYSPWFELNRILLYLPSYILYGRNIIFNHSNKILKVAHIVGADMMFKRAVLQQLGGFDSDFFMYCEETELCFRVTKLGLNCYSVPQAKIIHLEGKSFSVNQNREKRFLDGRKTYYRKTQSTRAYNISNKLNLIALYIRQLTFIIQNKTTEVAKYREKISIFKSYIKANN